MGFNNKFFQDAYAGQGLDLYWEGLPYSAGGSTTRTSGGFSNQYTLASRQVGDYADVSNNNHIKYSILSKRNQDNANLFVMSNLNVNNDDKLNNTSLIEIISYLQGWSSTHVNYSDFAYLKNLGVYPTNRLIIARRFSAPTPNNLYQINNSPMSTLISWIPDDENFLSVSFKEEWEDNSDYSFTNVFADVAGDFGVDKTKAGKKLKGGLDIFTAPGITEAIQVEIRKLLGLTDANDPDYDPKNLPSGNPNLIRESSRRALPDPERTGSGLKGKFSIKFETEYELKFINGVDPSLVYLDIIQNALTFGTSRSVHILGTNVESSTSEYMKALLSGDYSGISKIIDQIITGLKTKLEEYVKEQNEIQNRQNQQGQAGQQGSGQTGGTQSPLELLGDFLELLGQGLLSKYRIRILAVLQTLTGAPSAYWHVTIGNPKNPILSSGDMICGDVTLTMGKVLGYNDLPSSIKIEFTLTSARNLGGQEIFNKLNTGQSRTYLNRTRAYYDEFFGADGSKNTRVRKFIDYTNNAIGEDQKNNPGPRASSFAGDSLGSPNFNQNLGDQTA